MKLFARKSKKELVGASQAQAADDLNNQLSN